MSNHLLHHDRRQFLATSLLATAATTLTGDTGRAAPAQSQASGIPTRPFGKTGHALPILGMGCSAMVHLWVPSYGVPPLSTEKRIAMVRYAYDRGIRYFDTARVYFESESILAKGLKGLRDKIFVATKIAVTDPKDVRRSLEESLRQLDMPNVDLVQIHSPAIERVGFDGAMKLHAELVRLRDEKLFRFIGLTTHVAYETVYRLICTGGFDQVLLAYGYFHKGMDTLLSHRNLEWRELCLAKSHELGMAIVAMKVMGASIFGHNAPNLVPDYDPKELALLPGAAIRWVLNDDRVSLLNIGISLAKDVDSNLDILKQDLRLTPADRERLAGFSQRAYDAENIKKMRIV